MKVYASLILAALVDGTLGFKKVVYPLQDATIFGGEAELAQGIGSNTVGTTKKGVRRALVQFDLSSIPTDAIVQKVTVDLDVEHALGDSEINMHRITSPWSVGTAEGKDGSMAHNDDVTWAYSTYSTVPWKKEGGDYDSQVLSNEKGDVFLTTTPLQVTVEKMIHGSIPNFGFILIGKEDGEATFQTFASMEESKKSHRPSLTIEFDSLSSPAMARKGLRNLASDGTDGGGSATDATEAPATDGTDGTGSSTDGTEAPATDGTDGSTDGTQAPASDGTDGSTDGTDGGPVSICFPGSSVVEIQGKGLASMDSLEIGDFVRVENDQFAQVYSFGHFQKNVQADYLQISASGLKSSLVLSADHMVFVQQAGSVRSIAAANVKIGDMLVASHARFAAVTKVETVVREGAFAPFTAAGSVVVNEVVASNYVSFFGSDMLPMQWIAHTFNAPHRMICSLNFAICEKETYTATGLSHWIAAPLRASQWFARQNGAVQGICLGFIMAFLVMVKFAETLFMSPVLAVVCGVGYLIVKKSNKNASKVL